MSLWLDFIASARFQPLVFALLHTLWIGILAAGLLAVVLRCLPASMASLRYVAAMLTQLSIVLAALVMWVWLDHAATQPALPTAVVGVAESGDRLLTELPLQAIRAILLHELAHIRRHDYLLNLMQMLVESVLFFNPAIWWVSRQIRIEREACCDALAVRTTGEPIAYSQALAAWAERLT